VEQGRLCITSLPVRAADPAEDKGDIITRSSSRLHGLLFFPEKRGQLTTFPGKFKLTLLPDMEQGWNLIVTICHFNMGSKDRKNPKGEKLK